MKVFISAVDEGNFTKGAQRSNISQPAAVSIIDEIEETVGEPLFERAGRARRATLTASGHRVYETFVRTLSVYDRALETICAGRRQPRLQKILIQSPYVASVSPRWLREMISQETETRVSIHSAGWREIFSAIESREDCMALIDGDIRLKSSEYISIGSVEMVFVIPETNRHFNTNIGEIDWEDVPADTVIYSDICPGALERTYQNLRMAGNDTSAFTEVRGTAILKNFCQKAGVPAIVPRNLIDVFGDEIRLRCLPFAYSKLFIPLGLSISHGNRMRGKIVGRSIDDVFDRRFYV